MQQAVNDAGRTLGAQPAHPFTEHNDDGSQYFDNIGLTKRELIAAMAMQALVSSNDEGAGDRLTEIPEYAVQIADALLAELAKGGDQ